MPNSLRLRLVALLIPTLALLASCGTDDVEIPPLAADGGDGGGGVIEDGSTPEKDGGDGSTGDAAVDGDAGPVVGLDVRPANTTCKAFTAPPPTGQIRLVNRFPAVTAKIGVPTGMFQRPGDNARWYVTERGGRIWTFPNNPNVTAAEVTEVLNLVDVTLGGATGNPAGTPWDCSLSALAFPASFATEKRAYVSYCYMGPETGDKLQVRVSRFATQDGGLTLDRASEQVIVALDHPGDAAHPEVGLHTSDAIRFGKDGFLYVAIGDGGPQGRGGGTQAQDTNDLRGKLLRLDVSDLAKSLSKDFVPGRQRIAANIPPDNPFAVTGGHPAVYAYGFRNPWQWHFDRKDNSIWLGDVGNGTWEEVDRAVTKGGNYGWSAYEGFACTNHFPALCTDPTVKMPLLVYRHGTGPENGNAISGGLVYRGSAVPSLTGSYVFGDSSRQHIWAVRNVDVLPAGQPPKELLFDGTPVSSFAEDQDGELYATTLFPTGAFAGKIWAFEEAPLTPGVDAGVAVDAGLGGGPPDLLSKTGCFDAADPKTPLPALVPYAPSAELYSDNATKRRWLAMPDSKTIAIGADGDFDFPTGSVLIKEFSVAGQRIETRFFVRQEADGRWAGYTYQWREDQTDAALVASAGATYAFASGQTWSFPTRAQCHQCHTRVAGSTLGLEIGQLNHELTYASTGRTANQLFTLASIGLLDALPGEVTTLPRLAAIGDLSRTVDERARAYLHANCASCHRPEGPTFTPLDLRFQTSFKDMGICDALPTIDDLAGLIPANPRIFAPGEAQRSVLYWRLQTTDPSIRMPPVGRSLSHVGGVALLSDWITSRAGCL